MPRNGNAPAGGWSRSFRYAAFPSCRRKFVLEYLDEEWPDDGNCGGCDNCLQPREQYDATEIAQKILSAVRRTGERFGAAHVIDVLRGGRGERIRQQGHDQLSVYGIAASHSRDELRDTVEELKREGLLAADGGEYPTMSVTRRGWEFLKNRETLTLARPVQRKEGARESRNGRGRYDAGDGGSYDEGLYNELSALRKQIAEQRGIPAFMIFGNRTLQDMARKAPRTPAEFARVSGVGRTKLEDLGGPFLARINAYMREHGGVDAANSGNQLAAAEPAPRIVGQSYRETGQIISGGASLEDAAEARGLSAQTILGHIERLVESGIPVEWAHLLPSPERRAAIETAFEIVGDNPLRPVWEELGGEYSYDEIRLVRLARRHPEQPEFNPH